MRFDLEKLLTFWQLRDIVVPLEDNEAKLVGHKRLRLDNGTVNLSVLYYKIGDEYELSFVQRIVPDLKFGTSITQLTGDEAMEELNKV